MYILKAYTFIDRSLLNCLCSKQMPMKMKETRNGNFRVLYRHKPTLDRKKDDRKAIFSLLSPHVEKYLT